jgi:uncharacterized protein (TIRG00374 family)
MSQHRNAASSSQATWRRWIPLLLFAGIAIVVITRFARAKDLVATLMRGNPWWVIVGILSHIFLFVMTAQLYVLLFALVGVESRLPQLLPIFFAGSFINAAIPAGGAGAAALYVDDARRRGQSGARAAVGTILELICELVALLPFLIYGVWFLYVQGRGVQYALMGGSFYTAYVLIIIGMLFLAQRKLEGLRQIMERVRQAVNRVANWLHRDPPLGSDWTAHTIDELAAAADAIVAQPRRLLGALAWAMLKHSVNIAGLYAFFVAFHQPVNLGVLVAGFAMGFVFFVITLVPHVIAVVEGVMLLVFTSQGIPASEAGAVIVVFRGVSFWLPVIIGFLSLRLVPSFRPRDDREAQAHPSQEAGKDRSSAE